MDTETKVQVLVIILITLAVMLPGIVGVIRLDNQPVQEAHVEVISKRMEKNNYTYGRTDSIKRYVIFRFLDGSEVEFYVAPYLRKIYDSFQEGDTGILFYKQVGDGTKKSERRFVDFQKDKE